MEVLLSLPEIPYAVRVIVERAESRGWRIDRLKARWITVGRAWKLRGDELVDCDGRPIPLTASLKQLAEMQGVQPLTRPDDLAGGWPADENVDDFIETTYASRR